MNKIPNASMVGCFIYAIVCSRPDLTYFVSLVSIFMSNLGKAHWHAIKYIFQHLNSTFDLVLQFDINVDN